MTKLLIIGAVIVVILLLAGGGYYLLNIGRVPTVPSAAMPTPSAKSAPASSQETTAPVKVDDTTTNDATLAQDDASLDQSLTKLDQDTMSADSGINDVSIDLNSP